MKRILIVDDDPDAESDLRIYAENLRMAVITGIFHQETGVKIKTVFTRILL